MALKVGAGDLDGVFRQTLASVRQVWPNEARSIQPLHLQVVIAQDGDTAEIMAGRMTVVERPLERFLLLNGLDKAGPLKVGERYKIVVE